MAAAHEFHGVIPTFPTHLAGVGSAALRRNLRAALVAAVAALACAAGPAFAAVSLGVELNPNPARPGETIRVQFTVANDGPGSAASVTLRATVPAGIDATNPNYMSVFPTGCNPGGATSNCDPGDVMTFALGTIPAGRAVTVLVPLPVAAATTAGTTIQLTADVFVNGVQTLGGADAVAVDDDNALTLAVDEDANGVAPGGVITYSLTYGNRGADAVNFTALNLPLPPGATLVSASGGGAAVGGAVGWTLGSLAAGQSGRQQAVVQLPGSFVAGDLVDLAAISVTGVNGAGAQSALAHVVTAVGGGTLGIAIEVNPDPVRANERLHTEITLTNRGAANFSGSLRLRMPDNIVAMRPAYSFGTTGGCSTQGPTTDCDARDLVLFNIGGIAPGAAMTFSLPPLIAPATSSGVLITWEALVYNGSDISVQSVGSHTAAVDGNNPLSVAVDDSADTVTPGGKLSYTLKFGNRGADTLIDAVLRFPVPAGTTVMDAGGGTVTDGTVSWDLGTLEAGESGRRVVTLSVGAGVSAGTLLRVDAATLDAVNATAESARGTAATHVGTSQGLGLSVETNPDPVRPNERLRTVVTVSNQTAGELANVGLRVRLPDQTDPFSVNRLNISTTCTSTGSADCDPADVLFFSLGRVPAGASVSVTLPPVVSNGTADGMLLAWEALANADVGRRTAHRHTIAVDNGNSLTLGLDDSADAVAPGDDLTYTLTYGNRGAGTLTGTTLRLPLPAGTTFVAASEGGVLAGGAVQWTIGSLAGGASGRRQAVVTVDAGAMQGSLLVVDPAVISGTGALAEEGRAVASTSVRTGAPMPLAIEVNPDPVRQDGRLPTEIAVTNVSAATLAITLRARVPDSVAAFLPSLVTGAASGCANPPTATACDPGELISINVGNLDPGEGTVISLPPVVAAGTESGRLIAWEAIVTGGIESHQSVATHHVAVDNDNALALSVDDTPNGAPANGVLTYVLTYGNRGATALTDTSLDFPLPAGTTLLSSTGGTLVGNVVTFNLGTLGAGQGGRRQLRVQLGPSLPAGSLIDLDGPQVMGTSAATGVEAARSSEVTPIEAAAALPGLLVTNQLTPDPVQPAQALTGAIVVSNNSGLTLQSVTGLIRVPDHVNAFAQPSGTSGCFSTGPTTNCDPGDLLNWAIQTMTPGLVVTLNLPLTVASGGSAPVNGQLLYLHAQARDSVGRAGTATDTALIGVFTDADTDQIPQIYDNCLTVANPDQRDTNFDGFGNLCDGDLNNGLSTNAGDLALFRTVFGDAPASPLRDDADFNGSGGFVNAADLAIFRTLFGRPPGPSALAP
jgi:uncharacterized repeat protein (TIGR01451 family)